VAEPDRDTRQSPPGDPLPDGLVPDKAAHTPTPTAATAANADTTTATLFASSQRSTISATANAATRTAVTRRAIRRPVMSS
jgi:hypothetical protein